MAQSSRNLDVPRSTILMRLWQAVASWVRCHLFVIALGTAGLGALAVHISGLTGSPPGFYVDEASIGYNAYAISVDGRDEHGASWPLLFQAFGEYKNPVLIYLIAGAMRLFGSSVGVVRVIPSLLSLVTAVVLGWLAYRVFRHRWLGLMTFVVAATLPWLFVIGRIGFEVSALPPALALFLLAWWNADQERSRSRRQLVMAILAGLSLGVAIYAYTTARLLAAILVAALWVAYLRQWERRWRPLTAISLTVMVCYLPMFRWSLSHPGQLLTHFNDISIFCRPVSSCSPFPGIEGTADDQAFFPQVVAERFLRVYSAGWSPSFLFYSGDPYGRHVTSHGGMLYVALAPFLFVGSVALVRRWREPFWRLIGLGAAFGAIPAALTMHLGHALRTIDVVPFLIVIMALGAADLIRALPTRHWIVITLGATILVEMSGFMIDYFTVYPIRQAFWFDPGLETAIDTAQRTPHRGSIRLSNHIDQASIMYAFFSREDPKAYRAQGVAGGGALVGQVGDIRLPPQSVVVAKPDESVLNATLVRTVTVVGEDHWGHSAQPNKYYSVWLTH